MKHFSEILLAGGCLLTCFTLQSTAHECVSAHGCAAHECATARDSAGIHAPSSNILVEMSREALRRVASPEALIVLGHKSQDPDAVCSAIAMAELLRRLGVDAKPAMQNEASQGVKYILDRFACTYPELYSSELAAKPTLLVDHNDPLQSPADLKADRIVGLVDHHGISSSFSVASPVFIRTNSVGSTNTLVYILYKESGVVPSEKIAGIMLSGIIADTDSLSSATSTGLDSMAVSLLIPLSGVADISALTQGIMSAKSSYEGMTDTQILKSDMKEYLIAGKRICVACLNAGKDMPVDRLSSSMRPQMCTHLKESGAEMIFCIIADSACGRSSIICEGEGAEEALARAYPGAEGRKVKTIDHLVGRKSDFIPAISAALSR